MNSIKFFKEISYTSAEGHTLVIKSDFNGLFVAVVVIHDGKPWRQIMLPPLAVRDRQKSLIDRVIKEGWKIHTVGEVEVTMTSPNDGQRHADEEAYKAQSDMTDKS